MKSQFLNFDLHRERITAAVVPFFVCFPNATFLRVKERIDRTSGGAGHHGLGGYLVRNPGTRWEGVSRGKSCWCPELG